MSTADALDAAEGGHVRILRMRPSTPRRGAPMGIVLAHVVYGLVVALVSGAVA